MKRNSMFLALTLCFLLATLGFTQAAAQQPEVRITDGPRIEYVDDNSAKIAWSTDVESSATVRYGTDRNNLNQTAQQKWGGEKGARNFVHRVELKNLRPSTTYYFVTESGQARTASTVGAKSDIQTLQTKSVEQARSDWRAKQSGSSNVQAGPVIANLQDDSASIWWMIDNPQDASLKYGKDKNNLDKTAQSNAADKSRIDLTGLEPNTTYHFQLVSQDNQSRAEGQFKTEATGFDQKQLRITSGPVIEMLGKDTVAVAWGTSARASSVVKYGTDPNNLSQSLQGAWGMERHRVEILNLKPDTTYYFSVVSQQAAGGESASSLPARFTTVKEGEQALQKTDWK
jgi:phosphodiesterase/alkaline phosphatase D-like protein